MADLPPRTPRQREVAGLKAHGLSDKLIAALLGIARATVRSHRTPAHLNRTTGRGKGWRRRSDG